MDVVLDLDGLDALHGIRPCDLAATAKLRQIPGRSARRCRPRQPGLGAPLGVVLRNDHSHLHGGAVDTFGAARYRQ